MSELPSSNEPELSPTRPMASKEPELDISPAATNPAPITALVLTYNGQLWLNDCLDSLNFCQEIIVLDSFSTDDTVAIARSKGVSLHQNAWPGALAQFELGLSLVKTPWVITLDQDEICSEELKSKLLTAIATAPSNLAGFYLPRKSWYYDRFLQYSGWYPDYLLRAFRLHQVQFTQSGAHEHIKPLGPTLKLSGDILHYPYANFAQHLDKINSYAQQGADDLQLQSRKGGLLAGILHGIGRFLRIYLLKKGFLDGKAGFINAIHGSFYAFLKYIRINEGSWGKKK